MKPPTFPTELIRRDTRRGADAVHERGRQRPERPDIEARPSIATERNSTDGTRLCTNAVPMTVRSRRPEPRRNEAAPLAGPIRPPRRDHHADRAGDVRDRADEADLERRAGKCRLQDLRQEKADRVQRDRHDKVDERQHPVPAMTQGVARSRGPARRPRLLRGPASAARFAHPPSAIASRPRFGQDDAARRCRERWRYALEQEQPLPAGETAGAVDRQQRARERSADDAGDERRRS